jgi:lipoprotein-anchoring transpeptidase ErfK/SrfK
MVGWSMRKVMVAAAGLLLLAGCGLNGTDNEKSEGKTTQAAAPSGDETLLSRDPTSGQAVREDIPDAEARPTMQLQVVLERLGFGPGVIDGKEGLSTRNALAGFQEANDLAETGKLDDATKAALAGWSNIPATRVVTIPESWGAITFAPTPDKPEDQAKLTQLGYQTLDEKLAERFHTTVETLALLNPGGRPARAGETPTPAAPSPSPSASPSGPPPALFRAGQQIRVPNVGADRIDAAAVDDKAWLATLTSLGVGTTQAKVTRVVVSKSKGTLKAFDKDDKLVALFTVTSGSSHDPLPLGEWGINVVSKNPPFAYNPELFWDVPDHEEKQMLPPGPNGPVGVVWIDLTKEHYGIHGTPEPQTIGRSQSHGCVRLTNWDAARLALMVSGSTKVLFET